MTDQPRYLEWEAAGRRPWSYLPDCPANCLWRNDLPCGCGNELGEGFDNAPPHSHHLTLKKITGRKP